MNSDIPRILAIGDIHGCYRTFCELLFKQIGLRKSDTLYLLGDYIDRGPDSKGVLDKILELQRDAYDVRPILGNHEDMLLQVLRSKGGSELSYWLDNGGGETLKSFGVKHPEDIPEEYIIFLESLPLYRTDDTHVFVHAGLNFSLDNPLSNEGRNSMLWERKVKVDPCKIGGRKLVTGHTIMDIDGIAESLDSDLIQLDNGCVIGNWLKGKGALVALDLSSRELFVQENIE